RWRRHLQRERTQAAQFAPVAHIGSGPRVHSAPPPPPNGGPHNNGGPGPPSIETEAPPSIVSDAPESSRMTYGRTIDDEQLRADRTPARKPSTSSGWRSHGSRHVPPRSFDSD